MTTVPDELVQAALDAVLAGPGARPRYERALRAAFAKLPECEAAVQVAAGAVRHRPTCAYQPWNRANGGTGRCDKGCTDSILAALAQEFGGQT